MSAYYLNPCLGKRREEAMLSEHNTSVQSHGRYSTALIQCAHVYDLDTSKRCCEWGIYQACVVLTLYEM